MSAPTPPTSTSTSLSSDELREIVKVATDWEIRQIRPGPEFVALSELGVERWCYAQGVIAERLRGRELARTLANALNELRAWHRGEYQSNRDIDARADAALELARKAGLLEGGEK